MKFFIQPTACAVSTNIQTLELDHITLLLDQFPSIIDKIEQTVNQFRCPKGWKRLGGSCYYITNFTSISSHANHTCNHLHSNLSNLMQIRNAVELFYAAHVLSRNNLSSLMIDIDPSLLKGRKISETLMNDQDRWKRMKKIFPEERFKYQNFTKNIRDRLNSAGLRIQRRSRKLPDSSKNYKLNDTIVNNGSIIDNDEYEYDDFNSLDERDEFEQINDIRGICDDIHWNLLNYNNNATVYILTTYNMSNKIICSLSDVDPQTKYHHICEYVLDFCFANILCGKHGRCDHTLTGFKCACSFLFGGVFCERFSEQGKQILISLGIIICISGPIPWLIWFIIDSLLSVQKKHQKGRKRRHGNAEENSNQSERSTHLLNYKQVDNNIENQPLRITIINNQEPPKKTLKNIRDPSPSSNSTKLGLTRSILVGSFAIIILSILYSMILLRYYTLFKIDRSENIDPAQLLNVTIHLVRECVHIYDYRIGNLMIAPFACALILLFSVLTKKTKRCLVACDCTSRFPPPIIPFRMGNRLATATVFGILAFEVLKIFEQLFLSLGHTEQPGVLVEIFIKITTIVFVGIQYYPVLASLHLHNIVARFFTCLYIIANIISTIFREGSCMGYLPLSRPYTDLEEAKLRIELGTWFIVYGLVKNTPQFFFFSYIGAELFVRFGYDSIYVLKKKKHLSIWSVPDQQVDDLEFAKRYVRKLLRQKHRSPQIFIQQNTNINPPAGNEYKDEQQKKANQSWFKKKMNSIYVWDDDFRFTTMVVCTYTVAAVSLHYLACTFVFLYISRTTGHLTFLKSYIESLARVELGTIPFKPEIIVSAALTVIIYGIQLLLGMQYFKDDKKELLKKTNKKMPSMQYSKQSSKASKSVRYSGFLVGYMVWGFVICFHLILLILIGIRILPLQIRYVEIVLAIIVPAAVIYLLRSVSVTKVTENLFVQKREKKDEKRKLKNTGDHAIFIYFMFFGDCLIGIASCVVRLITATLANVISMVRLDYSFLGRTFDKYDAGYTAYVSYLRMELNYTHPIQIAFCSLSWDAIHKQPRAYHDEACCTFVDDDNKCEDPNGNQFQQNRTNSYLNTCRRNTTKDESMQNINHNALECQMKRMSKTSSRLQQNDSSSIIIHKNNPITVKYNRTDDETDLSIREIMPTPIPQNSTLISDKDSQKTDDRQSEQQTSNICNNQVKVEENDSSSTSRVPSTPGQQSRLPKPSSDVTKTTIHQELPSKQVQSDDEIYDDDGGLKPKSYSTITKLIPRHQPSLKYSTQTSTINTNNSADGQEDDEDGGMNASKIIKQKQKAEAKNRKKDDLKMKKQSNITEDFVDEDEDGAMSKRKPKIKKTKTKKKSIFTQCFQDQDDDGGVSKQRISAAEKKKPTSGTKKKTTEDTDDDDDGVPKRKEFIKKKTLNKLNISKKEEDDDGKDKDGGRVIKTHDTIKMMNPSEQAVLDNSKAKDESSSDNTNDSTIRTLEHPKGTTSIPVGTSDGKISKILVDSQNARPQTSPDKYLYKTVPTEDEQAAQTTTIDSSPLNCQSSFENKLYFLRTISYCKAQQRSPPAISQQQINFSSLRSRNNTIDHDNHYSEITNDTIQSCINEHPDSMIESIQSLSSHTSEQQTLIEENHTEAVNEKQRVTPRKIVRNRWYLAYTISQNPWLSKYRKKALLEEKRHRSRSQQSTPLNRHDFKPITTDQESTTSTNGIQSETLRDRRMRAKTTTSDQTQAPTVLRLLPMPNYDDDSQKPLEQPISIHSQMLDDTNTERTTIFHSISMEQVPTVNIFPQENVSSSILSIQTVVINEVKKI